MRAWMSLTNEGRAHGGTGGFQEKNENCT